MINLSFGGPIDEVLCLGAHPDDIEIGSLGLLRRLAARHPHALFRFVVTSGSRERRDEAESSMNALLGGRASLMIGDFEDGFLPYSRPDDVKRFVRASIEGMSPQIVVTPREDDRHQDHSFVALLAQQLLRDHLILEYEIAKYDGDLGNPHVFVALTDQEVDLKLSHLSVHFVSQHGKPWYDDQGFRALLRLRGIESNSPSGYAEAFRVRKMVLE